MIDYMIKAKRDSVQVVSRENGQLIAEYGLYRNPVTGKVESSKYAAEKMRKALERQLSIPGNTLGNYQW